MKYPKISLAKTGNKNPNYGKHLSEETKAKMRAKAIGRKHSEETKKKLSELNKGSNHPMFGRQHSEQTIAKMRDIKLGIKNPMYGRSQSGEKNPNWKGNRATEQTGRDRAEKLFDCPKGMERHHIDGNPLNNSHENVMIVTRKQHQIMDGRLENRDELGRFLIKGGVSDSLP